MVIVASASAWVAGIGILVIFAVLGGLMALFPRESNRLRLKIPGQLEGSDWYLRLLGVAISGFAIACAVLIILFAK